MTSIIQSPDVLHIHPSILHTPLFIERLSTSSLRGTLNKWINYIQGWQSRCFFLTNISFSYYKTEHDLIAGNPVDSVSLKQMRLIPHQNDDQRFDVVCNGDSSQALWYIRCSTAEECRVWLEAIFYRQASIECSHSATTSDNSDRNSLGVHLSRHPSMNSRSAESNASFTQMNQLKAQIEQMATFKDNCDEPIGVLDEFFEKYGSSLMKIIKSQFSLPANEIGQDALLNNEELTQTNKVTQNGQYSFPNLCDKLSPDQQYNNSEINKSSSIVNSQPTERITTLPFEEENQRRDLIGAAHSFKTNSEGYVNGVNHCIELMQQRGKMWQLKIKREKQRRQEVEDFLAAAKTGYLWTTNKGLIRLAGPDQEEGPYCQMDEEEFFDAVEFQLDLMEKEEEMRQAIRSRISVTEVKSADEDDHIIKNEMEETTTSSQETNPFYVQLSKVIEKTVKNHLDSLKLSDSNSNDVLSDEVNCTEFDNMWQLIKRDGEMRVYESLLPEQPGMIITPLLAIHSIQGATAREMIQRFWEAKYRLDWERTLDAPPYIIKMLDENTALVYQLFKRVWPTTQRYAFFWSTRLQLAPNRWIAVNSSLDPDEEEALLKQISDPLKSEKDGLVRARLNVSMYCHSEVNNPQTEESSQTDIDRSCLTCHVKYNASVNPGGCAPASVMKTIYRREYPRFVSLFVKYVSDAVKEEVIHPEDIN